MVFITEAWIGIDLKCVVVPVGGRQRLIIFLKRKCRHLNAPLPPVLKLPQCTWPRSALTIDSAPFRAHRSRSNRAGACALRKSNHNKLLVLHSFWCTKMSLSYGLAKDLGEMRNSTLTKGLRVDWQWREVSPRRLRSYEAFGLEIKTFTMGPSFGLTTTGPWSLGDTRSYLNNVKCKMFTCTWLSFFVLKIMKIRGFHIDTLLRRSLWGCRWEVRTLPPSPAHPWMVSLNST